MSMTTPAIEAPRLADAAQPPAPASARLLSLAVWFALATTAGELAPQAIKEYLLHRGYLLRPHVPWVVLAVNLLAFGVTALILAVAARARRRAVSTRTAVGVFAFVAILTLLFHVGERFYTIALIALAAGLALQVARLAGARPLLVGRVVRLTLAPLALLILGGATALVLHRRALERDALAALPPAPAGAPNVLLLILDTVRAQSLSVYGYERPTTPTLERIAGRGVRFDRAFATASWTLPSHASMFTGRYPYEMPSTEHRKPLDSRYPTLAEVLDRHGYATAGFTANWEYFTHEHGLGRGLIHFDDHLDYNSPRVELVRNSVLLERLLRIPSVWRAANRMGLLGRRSAGQLDARLLRWLDGAPKRPFFVVINYFDAHMPYIPPAPFAGRYTTADVLRMVDSEFDGMMPKNPGSAAEVKALKDRYDECISYVDHEIGQLLGALDQRGVLDNTLVVVVSDHGETLGEHGLAISHPTGMYMTELHVPLLMSLPSRLPSGAVVSAPVTLRDLPATILDIVGIRDGATPIPGSSLAALWRGDASASASPVLAEVSPMPGFTKKEWPLYKGDMRSLVQGRLQYIVNGDGREELYDIASDPLQTTDLAASPEHQQDLARLRSATAAARSAQPLARR